MIGDGLAVGRARGEVTFRAWVPAMEGGVPDHPSRHGGPDGRRNIGCDGCVGKGRGVGAEPGAWMVSR